jgi:predicted component of type VI protein secretion system
MSFLNRFVRGQPQDSQLASIVRNLLFLLNSKRSYGALLCSFGLADYLAEQGGENTLRTLLREIRETIEIYEPRLLLHSLRVRGRDRKLRVVVEIVGQLADSYFSPPCQLFLFLHPLSGRVEIEVGRGA